MNNTTKHETAGEGAAHHTGGLYTLRALAGMVRRQWRIAGAVSVSLLLVASIMAVLKPRKYEAELRLLMKQERVEGLVRLDRGDAFVVSGEAGDSRISSEIELLRSRESLEQVIVRCGLIPSGLDAKATRAAMAKAFKDLEKNLKTAQVGKTNLIAVKYTARTPEQAAKVPNMLAELYMRKYIAVHRNQDTTGFFEAQRDLHRKELAEAQTVLAAFRQTSDVSLLVEQKQAALRRATEQEAALRETESQIRTAENRVQLLRRQLAAAPRTIETGTRTSRSVALIDRLKGQLLDLENKRTELLTRYQHDYPLVVEVEKQIALTRATLDREQSPVLVDQTHAVNPLRQSLEAEVLNTETAGAGLRARLATLTRDLAEYRWRQKKLETLTAGHDDLQRRVKIAEDNYLLYQKKQEEVRLAEALDQQKILPVAVAERASVPSAAADGYRGFILLLGFVIASFAGLAAALAAEFFRPARRLSDVHHPLLRELVEWDRAALPGFSASPISVAGLGRSGNGEQAMRARAT